MPVEGLLTEQKMTEADEPLRGAFRIEFIPTTEELLPHIALEDDD
jgi:hypothetical protein